MIPRLQYLALGQHRTVARGLFAEVISVHLPPDACRHAVHGVTQRDGATLNLFDVAVLVVAAVLHDSPFPRIGPSWFGRTRMSRRASSDRKVGSTLLLSVISS